MSITGVIFFGDSILAGTGSSERNKSCAKIVKTALSVPVSLKGRNWNTSLDGLARLETDVLKQKNMSHVIILFGNNDCWPDDKGEPTIAVEQLKTNLRIMVSSIQANQQTPVICNLQLIDQKKIEAYPSNKLGHNLSLYSSVEIHEAYSKAIEKVAAEVAVEFIDIRSPLAECGREVIAIDGLHPNDLGHQIVAQSILNFLGKFS